MAKVDGDTLRTLVAAKHFARASRSYAESARSESLMIALVLMQDAVELFLIAAAEHVPNTGKPDRPLMDLFANVSTALPSGQQLPYQGRIKALNKARVGLKHHATVPDAREVEKLLNTANSFLEEATEIVFDENWSRISLASLIEHESAKDLILYAEELFDNDEFLECIIECRKAFYELFEWDCDISQFQEDPPQNAFAWMLCRAPLYSQSKDYIDRNVKTPFDFIVLNRERIEQQLLANKVNVKAFWNITRLSPRVYKQNKEWIYERTAEIEQNPNLRIDAEYILENLVDIILSHENSNKMDKFAHRSARWAVRPKSNAHVYLKASKLSKVISQIPSSVKQLWTTSSSPGLDGSGAFWEVYHFSEDGHFRGFLHEDDIDFED